MSKWTEAANGESCVKCGSVGATVLAHYSGPRQHDYGKGRSIKGADLIGAHLCNGPGSCHEYFDTYESDNDWERSEEFLHCVAMTIIRLVRKGLIK